MSLEKDREVHIFFFSFTNSSGNSILPFSSLCNLTNLIEKITSKPRATTTS